MVPLVLVILVPFVVPLFRNGIRLSTYEYFEKRFGFLARLYSSLGFVLAHFSKMGTVFFLVALALSEMMNLNIFLIIWVLGVSVVALTLLGGIEGVIWLDVIQGFMLMAGGLFCLGLLLFSVPGGPTELIGYAWQQNKIGFGPYDWDFTRLTFLVMAFNGIFYAVQKYGVDQTIVQRYLAARSDKDAIKASFLGVFLTVPVWALFMFLGTALFSFYHLSEAQLPPDTRPDAVFPFFIMTQLPPGVTGLILAALMAAAISSLDSDMNCLAAIGVEDYYVRIRPDSSDAQRLRMGKILVAVSGLAAVAVASFYARAGDEGVLGMLFALYAIFSGGIAGLFLLGIFSTRANKQGVYIGIGACVLFTAYALLTSTPIGIGEDKRLLLDLGSFNFRHHNYMLGVYTHLVVIGVGYLASFFFPSPNPDHRLTVYGWLQNQRLRSQTSEE